MADPIKNRYEFVVLFDVVNGNPNGDPDAGNMPRVDPDTGIGLVTDGCIKRKIRDYVEMVREGQDGYRIYVKKGIPLNRNDNEGLAQMGINNTGTDKDLQNAVKAARAKNENLDRDVRDWMCDNFFDIRAFGAVMTTMTKGLLNCGQVRGPVQFGYAHSVEPVYPQNVGITRVAITTEEDAQKKLTEMGGKYILPYGLYRCEGFISANLARKTTGFTEDDLALLWEAILNMFENDRASGRGIMSVRELIVFKHDSELGNIAAYKLFDTVHVERKNASAGIPARSYDDYEVSVDTAALPQTVTCMRMS